ncbi:HET-domain-containing protein, partial [Plenodomus tracheiphilus IPT5]
MDDSSTQSKINLSTALPCPRNVAIFTYQPLDASGSLRLLKVQPDTLDGFLQIELEEITDSTPYHCLSYMWGDQTTRFPIRLNGQAAHVGKNLYNFLKVAKRRFPGEAFWIDSLCINQADDHEKSSQVQRMGSIYRDATDVIIWFG